MVSPCSSFLARSYGRSPLARVRLLLGRRGVVVVEVVVVSSSLWMGERVSDPVSVDVE
jgi:hypothetical protein